MTLTTTSLKKEPESFLHWSLNVVVPSRKSDSFEPDSPQYPEPHEGPSVNPQEYAAKPLVFHVTSVCQQGEEVPASRPWHVLFGAATMFSVFPPTVRIIGDSSGGITWGAKTGAGATELTETVSGWALAYSMANRAVSTASSRSSGGILGPLAAIKSEIARCSNAIASMRSTVGYA